MKKKAAGITSPTFRALLRPNRQETWEEAKRRHFEDIAYYYIKKPVDSWRSKEWRIAAGILAESAELTRARYALVKARARGMERENILLKSRKQAGGETLKSKGDQQRAMNSIANEQAIEGAVFEMLQDPAWTQARPKAIAEWIESEILRGQIKIKRGRGTKAAYKLSVILITVRRAIKSFRQSKI